ncbi:hypothetical protein H0X48_00735 [Candidatus Dependentiae bacterium]|nr:hypothetical protein [Candidatus Dependentiae bacterium]
MNIRKSLALIMVLFVCCKSYAMSKSLQNQTVKQLIVSLYKTKQLPRSIYTICKGANVYNLTEQLQSLGYKDNTLLSYIGFAKTACPELIEHLKKSLIQAYSADTMTGQSSHSCAIILKAYIYKLFETKEITESQYRLFCLVSMGNLAEYMLAKYNCSARQLINLFFSEKFYSSKDTMLSAVINNLQGMKVIDFVYSLIIYMHEIGDLNSLPPVEVIKEIASNVENFDYNPTLLASLIAFRTNITAAIQHYRVCLDDVKESIRRHTLQLQQNLKIKDVDHLLPEDGMMFILEL